MGRQTISEQRSAARAPGDAPAHDGTLEPLRDAARAETAPRGLAVFRTQIFIALAVIALLIFSSLTLLVVEGLTASADLATTRAVQSLAFPGAASLMIPTSWPGFPPQSMLIVAATVVILWLAGYRPEAMFVLVAAASDILTETIKIVVGRPRPDNSLVHVIAGATGASFPSGHTLFYVTFFGFLAYLAYARLKHGWPRTVMILIFGLLIVLVGPSRIWMGQHWASDVLASYTLGFVYLIVLIEVYSRYRLSRTPARPPADVPSGED